MSYFIKPTHYRPLLDMRQTEQGIKQIKDFFQVNLSSELHLRRVTAPLFVLLSVLTRSWAISIHSMSISGTGNVLLRLKKGM